MAKIKFGAIVTDIRGSIDSVTYSRSRYGAYARKKVTPVNPATSAQSLARSAFGAASSLFRSLGAAVVDAWNAIAPEYQRSNIFGDNLPLSGSTLFTKLKTQLLAVGISTDPSPISPVTVPEIGAVSFLADVSDNNLELDSLPACNANQVIAIYATAPFSAGRSFVARSQYRFIQAIPASTTAGAADILANYTAVFGNPLVSANVGLKMRAMCKYVDTRNGQSGPAAYFDAVIVA